MQKQGLSGSRGLSEDRFRLLDFLWNPFARTALRILLQSDVVVIPKSTHKERMQTWC